jgi:hypothetical protein
MAEIRVFGPAPLELVSQISKALDNYFGIITHIDFVGSDNNPSITVNPKFHSPAYIARYKLFAEGFVAGVVATRGY